MPLLKMWPVVSERPTLLRFTRRRESQNSERINSLDHLRSLCGSLGIKRMSNKSKIDCWERIVEAKIKYDKFKASGGILIKGEVKEEKKRKKPINW